MLDRCIDLPVCGNSSAPCSSSLPPFAPARAFPAEDAAAVRIGVLAFLGTEAAIGEWSPVLRRLQAALPGRTLSLVQLDHRGLRDAAAAGEIDFLITNPGHYVELEAELGASRILTLDPGPPRAPERSIGSAVIVKAGNDALRTLSDLRGRSVAVVSTEDSAASRRSGANSPHRASTRSATSAN